MEIKKTYIILINYNSSNDTIECLESLLKTINSNIQIIIVDNSETDIPINTLLDWASGKMTAVATSLPDLVYPVVYKPLDLISITSEEFLSKKDNSKILLVKSKENKGFAAANNIALKYILKFGEDDSYVWLLNNDTVVEKNVPTNIILNLMNDKDLYQNTVYGTPLMEYSIPDKIQAIGGIYNKKTGLTHQVGENVDREKCKIDFDKKDIVDYPSGASMIVHKKFLEEIGLLCEDYFLYFEELDWVQRAKQKGGCVKILKIFGIYHKQGGSTNSKNNLKKPEFIDLIFLKSRIKFAKKFNSENLNYIYFLIFTLTIGKRVYQRNFKRIPKMLKILFKS